MLNGDVLTDLDVSAQLALHEARGARATLALTPVEDPSAYGLVRTRDDGGVTGFVEKPAPDQVDTHNISAGIYVLERSVLELLAPGRAGVDRARRVPAPRRRRALRATSATATGSTSAPRSATCRGRSTSSRARWRPRSRARMGDGFVCVEDGTENAGRVIPSALVERGCTIASGAQIGGRTVLEAGVTVGADTTIEQSVVLRGTRIGAGCTLRGCIVAAGVVIGDGTHIEGLAVLGEGVTIGADNVVTNGARVFPGVTIPDGGLRF